MKLGIVGGGRAAWIFGASWRAAGLPLEGFALRSTSSSPVPDLLGAPAVTLEDLMRSCDAILVAASDPAIPELAAALAKAPPAVALFQASGSLASSVFAPRARAFSLHPLRSLPPVGAEATLRGTLLVAEGTPRGLETAAAIAESLGARFGTIDPAAKVRYHAAAVLASNGVAALLDTAGTLLIAAGLDGETVAPALAELARSAIANWSSASPDDRFTGPVARGDLAMVRSHLEALRGDPRAAALYRSLSAAIAEARARDGSQSPQIQEIIEFLRAWRIS